MIFGWCPGPEVSKEKLAPDESQMQREKTWRQILRDEKCR